MCALCCAFSRHPLASEVRAQPQAVPCGICGAHSGTVTGVSLSTSFSPVNIIPPEVAGIS